MSSIARARWWQDDDGMGLPEATPAYRGRRALTGTAAGVERVRSRLFGTEIPPSAMGRYILLAQIGKGGLGEVFVAYDPELDRRVAIKLVRTDVARHSDIDLSALLQHEARVLARLSHPNVVSVYDTGKHAGDVFLVMELVDGETLVRWANREPLSWSDIRDLLVQAGRGLMAAHELGIVHGDFKPGNVLVDRKGSARVVDFGLASLLGRDRSLDGSSATPAGTPSYMAPEQWLDDRAAGHASDQWAFCVTAYELFYGARPFVGSDLVQLREAVDSGAIPSPPAGCRVPTWIHRALVQGLRRAPQTRHASMADLLEQLQRDKRRRWWTLASAITVVVTVIVTAMITAALVSPDPMDLQHIDALAASARSAAAAGGFVHPPRDSDGAAELNSSYRTVLALEQFEGRAAQAARAQATELRAEIAEQLVGLGDAYWDVDGGRAFASDFYAAALLFVPEHVRARQRAVITRSELAELRTHAAEGAFSTGELKAARVLHALADPMVERRTRRLQAVADDVEASTTTRTHIEHMLRHDGLRSHTSPATSQPSTLVKEPDDARLDEPASSNYVPDPNAAAAAITAGRQAFATGRDSEAEAHFHRALHHDHRSHAAMIGLCDVYFERAEFERALDYARRAVKLSPRNAAYRMRMGDILFKMLRYAEAREHYQRARSLGANGASRALGRLESRTKELR